MSFEGHVKDAAVRPTLTMKDTWKPWGHTQGQGKKGVEASISNHDPLKHNNVN